LPSLFIRAKRGTCPFANNRIYAIKTAIDIYYFNSGRAITASGGFFDEPIGSAGGMPQGGYRKPPARLVVMTISPEIQKNNRNLFYAPTLTVRLMPGHKTIPAFLTARVWEGGIFYALDKQPQYAAFHTKR